MPDANSQLAVTFVDSALINQSTSPVLITSGQGIFHGFLVITQGTGSWGATIYDSNSTVSSGLNSSTAVGVLLTATTGGVLGFQWGGDIIYNNGLVVQDSTGTTPGAIKILYL